MRLIGILTDLLVAFMESIFKISCFIILSSIVLSQESDFIIEKEISSPIDSVGDIACVDQQIYLLDDSSKCIFEIDENGNLIKELNFNETNITGISCLRDTDFMQLHFIISLL